MDLYVTVTKTSDGEKDYIQVLSDDCLTVNVVLVANKIHVRDQRGEEPDKK